MNKEEELRSRWCKVFCHVHKPAKKLKRLRKGKPPEVGTALNEWYGTVTSKGQKLSGPIEGRGFRKKLGQTNFVATEDWLSRWKARHQIRYKWAHGEKGSADIKTAEEWTRTILPGLLEKYRPNEVYKCR